MQHHPRQHHFDAISIWVRGTYLDGGGDGGNDNDVDDDDDDGVGGGGGGKIADQWLQILTSISHFPNFDCAVYLRLLRFNRMHIGAMLVRVENWFST